MVTLVPCRCCWDALTVHKHNRGKLAKPLQKLKHLDHFSVPCDGNQHTGASDWRDWILEQKAYKGHSEGVTGEAGAVQATSFIIPNMVAIIGLTMFKSSFPCHLWSGNTDLNFSAFYHIISLAILLQRTLLHYSLYLSFKYLQITYRVFI